VQDCDLLESVQQGIDAAFGAEVTLVGNRILRNDEEGFVLEGGYAELQGNIISNNGDEGVVIKSLRTHREFHAAQAKLIENFIEDNQGRGVFVTQAASVVIQRGRISNNQNDGLAVDEGAELKAVDVEISNHGFANSGIELLNADVVIQGGTLIAKNWFGIRAQGSTQLDLQNLQVPDNYLGVWLIDSSRAIIDGSTVTNNKDIGVSIEDNAGAVVVNSDISRNQRHGILLLESARVKISDSTISENGIQGIALGGYAQAEITNSIAFRNAEGGILISDDARAAITQSSALENEKYGISLGESAQAEILDSFIMRNGYEGIGLHDSAQAKISGSVISYNNQDGLHILLSSSAEIINSTISKNYNNGIALGHSAHVRIVSSTISENWETGIQLWVSAQADIYENVIKGNRKWGIFSASIGEVRGGENKMLDNGVDLGGNVPSGLRVPLVAPIQQKIIYPDGQYSSLQEAIDALLREGTLVLQSGEYDGGITLGKRIHIDAAPGAHITIKAKSAVLPVFSLIKGAELELSGLKITGGSVGFLLGGDSWAKISNSTISGNDCGLRLVNSAGAGLWNNSITDNRICGIFSESSGEVIGERNWITENGVDLAGNLSGTLRLPLASPTELEIVYPDERYGSLQEAIDALASGGRLILKPGNYEGGITIAKELSIEVVERDQATLQGKRYGLATISLVKGAKLMLAGLKVLGTTEGKGSGLLAGGDAQAKIVDASFSGGLWGIKLMDSAQIDIENSMIVRNLGTGIVLQDSSKTTITNSRIMDNGTDFGIGVLWGAGLILDGTSQAHIINSTFQNSMIGIYIGVSSRAKITADVISSTGTGIYLTESGYGEITSSFIFDNDEGISLNDSTQAMVINSTISRNKYGGIKLLDSARATIRRSLIHENGQRTVREVEGIKAIEIVGDGIFIGDSAWAEIWDNTISANEIYGVVLGRCDGEGGFSGFVTGGLNVIPGPDEPNGNHEDAVCPEELRFLRTEKGGYYP
jgi:parallel beta-helix repeat protein